MTQPFPFEGLPGRPCPIAASLELVGERWSLLVIREVSLGNHRFSEIARGTGEVDAVYHVAFDAMAVSVAKNANADQKDAWTEVVGQRRLLSYEALAGILASR